MAMPRQQLREARRRAGGLKQADIAKALGVAEDTYAAWERGIQTPRDGFRPKLARVLGVSRAEIDLWIDGEVPVTNGHQVPEWLSHLASLEQAASQIWVHELSVVTGLLQTADYAQAVEMADPRPKTSEDVAERVELRITRQQVLTRTPPLDLTVVLAEAVLHNVAGSGSIMADQLGHLVEIAETEHVTVQILPFTAGTFASAFGAFKVLFKAAAGGHHPYMACVEDRAGPHYLDRPHEMNTHVSLFKHLTDQALSPGASIDIIHQTSKELYQ